MGTQLVPVVYDDLDPDIRTARAYTFKSNGIEYDIDLGEENGDRLTRYTDEYTKRRADIEETRRLALEKLENQHASNVLDFVAAAIDARKRRGGKPAPKAAKRPYVRKAVPVAAPVVAPVAPPVVPPVATAGKRRPGPLPEYRKLTKDEQLACRAWATAHGAPFSPILKSEIVLEWKAAGSPMTPKAPRKAAKAAKAVKAAPEGLFSEKAE